MTDSRDNTASKILDSLKNDIISGEYLPKQKLHIKTLKEKYNVGTRDDIAVQPLYAADP